jgi:hypothetical protein
MSKITADDGTEFELRGGFAKDGYKLYPVEPKVEKKYWSAWFHVDGEDKPDLFCELLTEPQAQAVAEAIKTTLAYITTKSKYEPDTDPMDNSVQWARQLIWGNSE